MKHYHSDWDSKKWLYFPVVHDLIEKQQIEIVYLKETPLHYNYGNILLQYLISKDTNVNANDEDVHYASKWGFLPIVQCLSAK